MNNASGVALRPVIVGALVVCLAVAMAPWMSGGQAPLAMFMTGGALLVGVVLAWTQPAVRNLRWGWLVWAYLGLMAWAVASLGWTANRYSTAMWLLTFGMAGLAFWLAHVVVDEGSGRRWLVGAYVVSVGVFCGYGVWLYLSLAYGRFTGTFYWPNQAAVYVIPALLLAVHGLRRTGRVAWVWWGLLVLAGVAFVLTDSRAATLVLALMLVVYGTVAQVRRRQWAMLAAGLVVTVGLAYGCAGLKQVIQPQGALVRPGARFAEVVGGQSQSFSDRLAYLESAAEMWRDHPVRGVGAGAFGDAHSKYQGRVVSAGVNAHNFFVQTLAELGLVGAILLLGVLVAMVFGVMRGMVKVGPLGVVLVLGLAGLLLHMGLDMDSAYPALVMLVAVLAGGLYSQGDERRTRGSVWMVAGAVVLLPVVVSVYMNETWTQRARDIQEAGNYEVAAEAFGEAQRWPVHNPAAVWGEGVNLYALALADPNTRKTNMVLALDRARSAQKLAPLDPQNYQLEAWVLAYQGDMAGAERQLKRALELDPYNYPDLARDLAQVYDREGRTAEGFKVAQRMLDQYPMAVVQNRDVDPTVRPSVAELWAVEGDLALKQGRVAVAREAVAHGLEMDAKSRAVLRLKMEVGK